MCVAATMQEGFCTSGKSIRKSHEDRRSLEAKSQLPGIMNALSLEFSIRGPITIFLGWSEDSCLEQVVGLEDCQTSVQIYDLICTICFFLPYKIVDSNNLTSHFLKTN